jgi:hypothetical protein
MNSFFFLGASGLELSLFGFLKFLLEFLNLLSQVAFLIPRIFRGKHIAKSDEYDNHLLKDFYMPDASSCYEIDAISKLTAKVKALQYDIQI